MEIEIEKEKEINTLKGYANTTDINTLLCPLQEDEIIPCPCDISSRYSLLEGGISTLLNFVVYLNMMDIEAMTILFIARNSFRNCELELNGLRSVGHPLQCYTQRTAPSLSSAILILSVLKRYEQDMLHPSLSADYPVRDSMEIPFRNGGNSLKKYQSALALRLQDWLTK
uniref:Uncharacterized protein n=1 Tax=Glossina pallidipes TaxID=7398 RepID=A0A1B0AJR7_GLOPL